VKEDRHYTNFGFVRNAETLEWIGTAPLFDCGASMWYNSAKAGVDVPTRLRGLLLGEGEKTWENEKNFEKDKHEQITKLTKNRKQ
jgi:hypothetical protein